MIVFLILLFIIECGGFAYLFYVSLEINKDIDILYDKYAKELEKITNTNINIRKELLK